MTSPCPSPQPEDLSCPPAFREQPSRLFVEITTRCNLGCAMCVKRAPGNGVTEGDLSWETFAALEPAFPGLDALVLNGIGEPLLHRGLEEVICRAKEHMPASGWVGFQSNGLLLDAFRAQSLAEAGLDRICLSLDSTSAETFRRLRGGGELGGVERALTRLASAKTRSSRPDLRVGVEFVLMRGNLQDLPAALHWAACRGASFALVTQLIPYAPASAAQAAYPPSCSDAAIEIFDSWKKKAAAVGADITRYFEVLWKYGKTAAEQQIVHYVEEMKKDAQNRGILFDLNKLLQTDRSWLATVTEVFEESREIAEQTGLELHLPEIVPRAERLCRFIQDGGAFISWDGRVHPCHFLWHRYSSFSGGWAQTVRPKVLGSLAEKGILEIWNDPVFRAFRQGALGYDHSDCNNCSLAPCDYIQTDSFEHDCHLKAEPCGACLWSTGLFQCLS
ncbi:MAG: radical SAM/SPASM family putative metalloenzyme maturase [Desulfuromonadales bacterium]